MMEQPGFFDVEDRLARLSGLGVSLRPFPCVWILTPSALIWRRLWRIQMGAKAAGRRLIQC